MQRLEIISVCGFGIGSSLILKMTIDDMLKSEGIEANTYPQDVTSVGGIKADLIFTSNELYDQIVERVEAPVIVIDNFLSTEEVKEKSLSKILKLMEENQQK